MAIGMALGLVTLSGGRASLSRSNAAIACLVAALYPRFPSAASDNAYHPQPLRHLYALAVDFRGVEVRDVETGEAVHAPIEVALTGPASPGLAAAMSPEPVPRVRLLAPCVLPEVGPPLHMTQPQR